MKRLRKMTSLSRISGQEKDVRKILEKNMPNSRHAAEARSKALDEIGKKIGATFDRNQALWFMSLADKAKRQMYSKEELCVMQVACETALKNFQEEPSQDHGTLPSVSRPPTPVYELAGSEPIGIADSNSPSHYHASSYTSSPGLSSIGPASLMSMRSYTSTKSKQLPRSGSAMSRNFSLPLSYRSKAEAEGESEENGNGTSWLADTPRTVSSGTFSDSPACSTHTQSYQDTEARKQGRRLTTLDFNEALDFGFAANDNGSRSHSSLDVHEEQEGVQGGGRTYATWSLSDISVATPYSACPSPCVPLRGARSAYSLRPAQHDATLRLTLTPPGLRSKEEEIEAWQQEAQDSVDAVDPWALEKVPVSDDNTGKSGAFAAAEEKEKKSGKLWDKLSRK